MGTMAAKDLRLEILGEYSSTSTVKSLLYFLKFSTHAQSLGGLFDVASMR